MKHQVFQAIKGVWGLGRASSQPWGEPAVASVQGAVAFLGVLQRTGTCCWAQP